jgi:hypothetical protein
MSLRLRSRYGAVAACFAAGLLAAPAHAAPTAMDVQIDLSFPCYGCGWTSVTGTLACPGPCVHDGILCATSCSFPIEGSFSVPPAVACPSGTGDGVVHFGTGQDAVFTTTFVTNGAATFALGYADGSSAYGTGTFTITSPVGGTACGQPATARFTGALSGN